MVDLSFSDTGVSLDRRSGEATNCCGDYTSTGDLTDPTSQKDITHDGLVFKFPFGVEKTTYQWWDADLERAVPIEYQGEDNINGTPVYVFKQTIAPEAISTIEAPEEPVRGRRRGQRDRHRAVRQHPHAVGRAGHRRRHRRQRRGQHGLRGRRVRARSRRRSAPSASTTPRSTRTRRTGEPRPACSPSSTTGSPGSGWSSAWRSSGSAPTCCSARPRTRPTTVRRPRAGGPAPPSDPVRPRGARPSAGPLWRAVRVRCGTVPAPSARPHPSRRHRHPQR